MVNRAGLTVLKVTNLGASLNGKGEKRRQQRRVEIGEVVIIPVRIAALLRKIRRDSRQFGEDCRNRIKNCYRFNEFGHLRKCIVPVVDIASVDA
jgi:hypothetical protein